MRLWERCGARARWRCARCWTRWRCACDEERCTMRTKAPPPLLSNLSKCPRPRWWRPGLQICTYEICERGSPFFIHHEVEHTLQLLTLTGVNMVGMGSAIMQSKVFVPTTFYVNFFLYVLRTYERVLHRSLCATRTKKYVLHTMSLRVLVGFTFTFGSILWILSLVLPEYARFGCDMAAAILYLIGSLSYFVPKRVLVKCSKNTPN